MLASSLYASHGVLLHTVLLNTLVHFILPCNNDIYVPLCKNNKNNMNGTPIMVIMVTHILMQLWQPNKGQL